MWSKERDFSKDFTLSKFLAINIKEDNIQYVTTHRMKQRPVN